MFKYVKTPAFNENTSHGLIVNKINKGEKILEFGCAKGEVAEYLTKNLNCSVCGIEISREAIEFAKPYLYKAITADIEEYLWEKELDDELFDAIIFADVLEHLKNPEKALKEASKYLKAGGRILFSIPNIAHADIISKLINNRFDYTDIGLLDNTHIHFWGMKNIAEFCENSGLFLKEIDATYAPLGTTEQAYETDVATKSILTKSDYHNVYQFVCVAYTYQFAKENSLEFNSNLKLDDTFSAIVFFDRGNGFSEDDIEIFYDTVPGHASFTVNNLEDVKQIRVDLRKNGGYVSQNETFSLDGKSILPDAIVNCKTIDNNARALLQDDPQYIFVLPQGSKAFTVTADIISVLDFKKLEDVFDEAVKKSNNLIAQINSEQEKNNELTSKINKEKEEKKKISDELAHYKKHYEVAISQREDLKRQLLSVQMQYDTIRNAGFWKITKPLRVLFDFIKRIPVLKSLIKVLKSIKNHGFKYTVQKIKRKLKTKKDSTPPLPTKKDLQNQREKKFEKNIKISILVPLYNTPVKYLRDMIDSVIAQTYANWELCLADASDSNHTSVQAACKDYLKKDSRIKYVKLEKNLGISGNTNACIDMATGDYTALLDHDDILHPSALYEIMDVICNKNADFIYTDENTFHDTPKDAYWPHYKPDYSPDTLRSYNYICHLTAFKTSLLEKTGLFRKEFDGSQDYDMILRLTEKAEKIVHIPKVLYFWRSHKNSVASDISAKPYTIVAAKKALCEHLERLSLKGHVEDSTLLSTYRIKYEIQDNPLISIIIPNKDHINDLVLCVDSIQQKSTYRNFEIVIVENNSCEQDTFDFYDVLTQKYNNVKVVKWDYEFNYSKINNFGFKYTHGEYIVLLNNDIEITTPSWLEEMLMFVQRKDVGAAGMMLYYPDDTIQHAGVIIGIGGVAGHSHKYFKRGDYGYASRLTIAQNFSGVTAAAMMIKRSVFEEVSGLDESFAVAFNDVDLCLRIRRAGYLIVWTPYAEAYHYESKSRGLEDTPEKQLRFKKECDRFYDRWSDFLKEGDPYYNPNLTLEKEDFSTR